MPLYASAFFVPTSAGIPYILEDIYFRGGYRSVATVTERNAIKSSARKQGMICYVREESKLYWLPTATIAGDDAWQVFNVNDYLTFSAAEPLALKRDETTGEYKLSIDNKRVLPLIAEGDLNHTLIATADGAVWKQLDALPSRDGQSKGAVLTLDKDLNAIWQAIQALPSTNGVDFGSALVTTEEGPAWQKVKAERTREVIDYYVGGIPPQGSSSRDIDIPSGVVMLTEVTLSHPNLRLSLFADSARQDKNPYVFVSANNQLTDDGTQISEDGSIAKYRRYSFYVNKSGEKKMYATVINEGSTQVEISFKFTVLPME